MAGRVIENEKSLKIHQMVWTR